MVNSKKIIICGANGYIGSSLYNLYKNEGYNVTGLVRGGYLETKYQDYESYLDYYKKNDKENNRDYDALIIASGYAHVNKMIGVLLTKRYIKNIDSMFNQIISIIESGNFKKIMLISTVKCQNKMASVTQYSLIKNYTEKKFIKDIIKVGVSGSILRIPLVYDEYKSKKIGNLAKIEKYIQFMPKKVPILDLLFENKRSIVSIHDIYQVLKKINLDSENSIVTIAGKQVSTGEIISSIANANNKKIQIIRTSNLFRICLIIFLKIIFLHDKIIGNDVIENEYKKMH